MRRSNCLRRGEFTLSSGRKTRIYIDLRSILSHPKEFKMLV
ncbi:MAG TPA: orotate phosphoribosyltransferase, partial [Nitrososphaeria archaeon]|nr:orotate phosphoribosyltransferase [Nitrososphaeria archaeon]